jgi:ATP-binding cassette subfamily F protein 3
MMRDKKLDRLGNYREDGKRYKLKSLKKLSEDSVRLAQKVVIETDEPVIKMNFPNPTWPPAISTDDAPIMRMEHLSFGYCATARKILDNVTLSSRRGSKVALVGRNGAGKSSMVSVINGDFDSSSNYQYFLEGSFWVHPGIRIGHVSQYSVEELEMQAAAKTVLEYAEETLMSGRASAEIVAKAAGNVRNYLGAFGLGGKHALRKIGTLSGGERMRLCFAKVLADEPHLLLLDESTNHVDLETLESMSAALNAFEGAVLMVSHNQAFLSGFCNELWILEDGKVTVNHSDTETFDGIFFSYRNSVLNSGPSLSSYRHQKAKLAKRARQTAGTQQNTALL